MALYPLSPGMYPLGEIDMLDTEQTSLLGGEVLTLTSASRTNTSTETAAPDVLDGYSGDGSGAAQRTVATVATLATQLPVFLADEGSSPDYMTLFGRVVGASAGLVTAGAVLGPHTTTGSGKVTLWDKPGLYVVTTDAVAADFLSTEQSLSAAALQPNDVLGFNASGKLAHAECTGAVADSGVAHFLEFESGRKTNSLVNTPPRLVGATESFDRVKVWFHAGLGNRTVAT